MGAPGRYIAWVKENLGFNPRGQKASDALSDSVVSDLTEQSRMLREALRAKVLHAVKNGAVGTGVAERDIDLILSETPDRKKARAILAVENKSVMTAHGKARKNRLGDIVAYCNHLHNHRAEAVAGAIVVVNISASYENPDAFVRGLKRPKFDMEKVVRDTIAIFAAMPLREHSDEP